MLHIARGYENDIIDTWHNLFDQILQSRQEGKKLIKDTGVLGRLRDRGVLISDFSNINI